MNITKRNVEAMLAVLRTSQHQYVAVGDGWLAVTDRNVVYAVKVGAEGVGNIPDYVLWRWRAALKRGATIDSVAVDGWVCTYQVSGEPEPTSVVGSSYWKTTYNVAAMLSPRATAKPIVIIPKLKTIRTEPGSLWTIRGEQFVPASLSDAPLFDGRYIANASRALRGLAAQVSLNSDNALVFDAPVNDPEETYIIAPLRAVVGA